MGVHGLWRLIEPSGKPVPPETLESKILAIDVSIWLHQAIKGFQDSRGASVPNAHLLSIYHRVCKLLYYRIRPVFVFDGGVPDLKKQTITQRNQQKAKLLKDASSIQTKLLRTLLKHTAVKNILGELNEEHIPTETNVKDDLYKLPPPPSSSSTELESKSTTQSSSSEDEDESTSPIKQWDLHTIDEKSEHFTSLPADIRHEILTDLIETRKQSSWGKIHEMPAESGDFSQFQMKRLLKRYSVQVCLEAAEKEMGGHSLSLNELEILLNEKGIVTNGGCTVASDEQARYLYIENLKKKLDEIKEKTKSETNTEQVTEKEIERESKDKEFENDLAAAIQLSLQDQPSTSNSNLNNKDSFLERFQDGDFQTDSESDEEQTSPVLSQAKSYMTEYSGLTPNEIANIIDKNKYGTKSKKKKEKNITEVCKSSEENETDTKLTSNYEKNGNESTLEISDNNVIELMSDSDDSDLVEVNDCKSLNDCKTFNLEISIDPNGKIQEDDIFSDIFRNKEVEISTVAEIKNKNSGSNPENSEIISAVAESKHENSEIEIAKISESNPDNSELHSEIISTIAENKHKNSEIQLQMIAKVAGSKLEDSEIEIAEVSGSNPEKSEVIPTVPENKHENSEISQKIISHDIENSEIQTPIITENNPENSEKIPATNVENNLETNKNKPQEPPKPKLTLEELNAMKSDLTVEKQQLLMERNIKERTAGNITEQMYQEAQELLELFGIPYIIAPKEAEAQCAFLNEINLTDGTITDDSDIWLFGGKTVYKNFFNHNKYVMEFRAESIEHYFKLQREHLILLALLVGSDYTLGVQGIGPVTALEILASFPSSTRKLNPSSLNQNELLKGLIEFRKWLTGENLLGLGRTSLRNKLRNVKITEGFPSVRVIEAYLQPDVETSRENFTWAKPDVPGLIEYAREKFGWTKLKSEEILKPIIRRLEDRNLQKSIKDYFHTKHKLDSNTVENKMSKRVKKAVNQMGNENGKNEELEDVIGKKNSNVEKKIVSRRQPRVKKPENVHAKECIPQKEMDKKDALKNRLRAIEVFRNSKRGPGYVPKKPKIVRKLKEEAELSESSSSD